MENLKRPIIGVYMGHSIIQNLNNQICDFSSYPRISELVISSVEVGVTLYFFSDEDLYFKRKLVKGTFYDPVLRTWRKEEFPLPDVLYIRGSTSSELETELEKHDVIKVNCRSYFDKWELYQILSQDPELTEYLPYTRMYGQETDLGNFLKINDEVYLKGTRGGKGRWILRIRKNTKEKFEYSYFVDKIVVGEAEDWKDLVKEIHKFYGKRKFVLQKAINLIHINGRKVDFRAELQRNGKGELEIIGICARIGEERAPITIHSSAFPVELFLKDSLEYSDHEIDQLTKRMHNFLFSVYQTLEQVYGTFGEIGIDFGMDNDGKIWLIEANSRSAKVSLMKAYDEKTFHRAFVNPLEFAKYMYEQNKRTD
jgi:hypothetical protein